MPAVACQLTPARETEDASANTRDLDESAPRTRFSAEGVIPPVQPEFHEPCMTASELAYGAPRDDDHERKKALAKVAYDFGYDTFLIFLDAANDAIRLLDVPEIPETDTVKQLLGLAASALLGAGAGVVAAWLFGAVTTAGIAGKAAATTASVITGALKAALTGGQPGAATPLADIKQAFNDAFKVQLDVARRDYVGRQTALASALTESGIDHLQALVDVLHELNTGELRAKMRRETLVAWTNFLARAKHGAMPGWDYWQENGSPDAIRLSGAEQKPTGGGFDVTRGNIAPDNNSPLLERTQRPSQQDAFGVLEVFLWSPGHVVDRTGYRMRLDNVGLKVREELSKAGRVRDLKVNKVIHLCSNVIENVEVNPPASIASVLITADGYVRANNWSELSKAHFVPKHGPIWDPTGFGACADKLVHGVETSDCYVDRKAMANDMAAFADGAQDLPLSWLEA